MKILALKIYANAQKAYAEGVPRLLDIMDELQVSGSFFFGMGTESAGGPLRKLFGEPSAIVESSPGVLCDAARRGHDCGVSGWNPAEWEARLNKLPDTTLASEVKRAVEMFTRRTGTRPNGFAAPGWQVSYMSLRVQDDMRFKYCSDTFGFCPYIPKLSWKTFATPQIPDTLPPIEVALKGTVGGQIEKRLSLLGDSLPFGLTVLPMSAAVGASRDLRDPLRGFLLRCRGEGVKFMSLGNIAKTLNTDTLPVCEITFTEAHGMPRPVAAQNIE